jgi:hypothetical protein
VQIRIAGARNTAICHRFAGRNACAMLFLFDPLHPGNPGTPDEEWMKSSSPGSRQGCGQCNSIHTPHFVITGPDKGEN